MAPVAQTAPVSNDVGSYDGSRPRFQSLQAWLEIYGEAEYAVYQKDHAPSDLGYEEWATSVHAHGMYLWHAALDVWEEPSSSVSHWIDVLVSSHHADGCRMRVLIWKRPNSFCVALRSGSRRNRSPTDTECGAPPNPQNQHRARNRTTRQNLPSEEGSQRRNIL
jgi:hypothetical protein